MGADVAVLGVAPTLRDIGIELLKPFSNTESDTTPTRNASPVLTVPLHSPTTTRVPTGLPLKTALSRT